MLDNLTQRRQTRQEILNTEWSDRRKADKTGNGEYLILKVQSRRHDMTKQT